MTSCRIIPVARRIYQFYAHVTTSMETLGSLVKHKLVCEKDSTSMDVWLSGDDIFNDVVSAIYGCLVVYSQRRRSR